MAKTHLNITIDVDIAIWAKINVDNLSQEVNNYLRSRMQFAGTDSEIKKQELKKQLENHKKLIQQESLQAGLLQAQLERLEAKEKAEYDKKLHEVIQAQEAWRNTGALGRLGLRR